MDGGQGKELKGKGALPELGSQRPCQKRGKSKPFGQTSEDSESDKKEEKEWKQEMEVWKQKREARKRETQ